jgi:outer membrane receptor for ferrienterochelin and colicins
MSLNRRKITTLLLAALTGAGSGIAQTDTTTSSLSQVQQLEQVVITGLPNPQKLKDALSTYQVITKETMVAQGAVTVNDALRNQLNINIGSDNILGATTSMQGMKGDKVKILIDGMPVNGRENGEIDLGQINLNNVARIEVVQGPMSVVYGTDALGGVINIITARPRSKWGLQAGTYLETIGKYNVDIAGNYRFKQRHQLSLGGGRNFFDGWQPQGTLQRAFLWWPKEQYLANVAYDYTAKSSFRLRFATDFVREKLINKDTGVVNPIFAYGLDQYFYNTRVNTRVQMSGRAGKRGVWQMQNGYALYHRTKNQYRKDLVTLSEALSADSTAQDTTVFHDFNSRGSYTHSWERVVAVAGYDLNLEQGKSGKIADSASSIQDYAVYGSAEISILDKRLKLQPALRYAYNSVYQAPLIPSFNLLYSASDAIQIRGSYARGFRSPSMKELYLLFVDNNHQLEGNPKLLPETGHHVQASASWRLHQQGQDFVKILATGFYNNITNQIALIQPDTTRLTYATYTNISAFRNVMGTLQAEGQWKNIYAQVGATASKLLSGGTSSASNSYEATAMVQYTWTKAGMMFSTFYKYFGKQPRIEAMIDGSSGYNGVFAAYSFWDVSAQKDFWKKRISIIAGVKNMLNVQNVSVSGASGGGVHSGGSTGGGVSIAPGRTAFVNLRVNL